MDVYLDGQKIETRVSTLLLYCAAPNVCDLIFWGFCGLTIIHENFVAHKNLENHKNLTTKFGAVQ